MIQARVRSILALVFAAVLIGACNVQAPTSPSPAPTIAPAPTSQPAPTITLVPGGQQTTITQNNNGQTLTLSAGDTFLLQLGDTLSWTVTVDDQGILSRVVNIAVIRGAQGVYRANQPGTTTLHATGDPLCRQSTPPCAAPSLSFTLHVIVRGAAAETTGQPVAVAFISAKQGWAVSTAGEYQAPSWLLSTVDGGLTWRQVYSTTVFLERVMFINPQDGWLAGHDLSTCSGATEACPTVLLSTSDGGQSWSTLNTTRLALQDIQFLDAHTGWAIVQSASQAGNFWAGRELRRTADAGSTWTAVGLRDVMPARFTYPAGFTFVDAQHGWVAAMVCKDDRTAACFVTVLATRDGGKTWQQQDVAQAGRDAVPPVPADAVPQAITFLDQTHGWLLEQVTGACTMGGCWGPLFGTGDGGKTWTLLQPDQMWQITGPLQAPPGFPGRPVFASPQVGWIPISAGAGAGAGGVALTTDGGKTWTRIGGDMAWDIHQVSAVSATELWMVGEHRDGTLPAGFLAHSVDGGNTWKQVLPPLALSERYEILARDSGQTFVYTVTSRFQIFLDQQAYPKESLTLTCSPANTLASISNLPAVAPPLYAVRYMGVAPGVCTISDKDFKVTVRIVGL